MRESRDQDLKNKHQEHNRKEMLDSRLLNMLVCPLTKGPLTYDCDHQELISYEANLAYPIRKGIPIMLIEEARSLDEVEGKK